MTILKATLLCVSFHLFFQVRAQPLSQAESLNIANELYRLEVLSEVGRNDLVSRIQNKQLFRLKANFSLQYRYSVDTTTALSKAQILCYLEEVFRQNMHIRSGDSIWMENFKPHLFRTRHFYKNLYKKFHTDFEHQLSKYEPHKIEQSLEEELEYWEPPEEWGSHPGFGLSNIDARGFVHQNTSTLGRTREAMRKKLLEVGLIDSQMYKRDSRVHYSWGYEFHMLRDFAYFTVISEDKPGLAVQCEKCLNDLRDQGVYTESEDQMQRICGWEEARTMSRILRKCRPDFKIPMPDTPSTAEHVLHSIVIGIQSELTDLRLDAFHMEVHAGNPRYNGSEYEVLVSLVVDSHRYTRKGKFRVYNRNRFEDSLRTTKAVVSGCVYRIINQYFRDIGSDQKLFVTSGFLNHPPPPWKVDPDTLGAFVLTGQHLDRYGYFSTMERGSRSSRVRLQEVLFTTEYLQGILDTLSWLGFWKNLEPEQQDSIRRDLLSEGCINHWQLVRALPYCTALVDYGYEDPIDEIVEPLAESLPAFLMSRLGLDPKMVSGYTKHQSYLQIGNRKYRIIDETGSGFYNMNRQLAAAINHYLTKGKCPERLIRFDYVNSYGGIYLLLNEEQNHYLQDLLERDRNPFR